MVRLASASDLHNGYNGKTQAGLYKAFRTFSEQVRAQGIQALLLAGDLNNHRQSTLRSLFENLRTHLDIPILVCLGNHDLWDLPKTKMRPKMTYEQMLDLHEQLFQEFKIHYVDHGPYVIDDAVIVGFDGWYGVPDPHCYEDSGKKDEDGNPIKIRVTTNDRKYMPLLCGGEEPFQYLSRRAHKQLSELLYRDYSAYRAVVGMTHFPPYSPDPVYALFNASHHYMEPLTEVCDVLVTGHSHRREDFVQNGCRVLNSGAGRNTMLYHIFDV